MNVLLLSGGFPSVWKNSVVFPVLKVPNPSSFSSFRPISIPPFLSKILEQICFRQLSLYLHASNIIPTSQSGFRRGYSIISFFLHISDTVLRSYNNGSVSAIVGLDFFKAVDTVNHELLLTKLYHYGLLSSALLLFRSFLSGQKTLKEFLFVILFLLFPHLVRFFLVSLKDPF